MVQLTSDGHRMYLQTVEEAFAGAVDFTPARQGVRYRPAGSIAARGREIAAFDGVRTWADQ